MRVNQGAFKPSVTTLLTLKDLIRENELFQKPVETEYYSLLDEFTKIVNSHTSLLVSLAILSCILSDRCCNTCKWKMYNELYAIQN